MSKLSYRLNAMMNRGARGRARPAGFHIIRTERFGDRAWRLHATKGWRCERA
ncbi:hypothetical protein [Methylocaldum sp.]|uniref:hypothetical protein n=1 Tax=Methylocaldum sp. TaxID=1969727 RepID=UPI002D358BB6|nr:hypothetical protein [Methylocaldum sp.]HYE38191.1 hypothetical protein [Methylocaldum sp.]